MSVLHKDPNEPSERSKRKTLVKSSFFQRRESPKYKLIESFSNWQRVQWMKAGCPQDIKSLEKFKAMMKENAVNLNERSPLF